GTLVELTTFYTICAWGLRNHTIIERSIPEFGNPEVSHNVEFSLHPIRSSRPVHIAPLALPLTGAKIARALGTTGGSNQLLSRDGVLRNACIIAAGAGTSVVANVDKTNAAGCELTVSELLEKPFAIFECKRVGVEQGMKKGPQTIEKAKQGAYVARAVSALQKIRLRDGQFLGVIERRDHSLYKKPYAQLMREIIDDNGNYDLLREFILTVGIVSNHGNWFTAENMNKELVVLAQSYDWLLFLTDHGLAQFIEKLLLHPTDELSPARAAFLASYTGASGNNRFTKVKIDVAADKALRTYFTNHEDEVESWFNVIAPRHGRIVALRDDLKKLTMKDWEKAHAP
ncbi:MAG: hypothetical protein ABL962_12185, partial [Fimbriimonadaceae bacterium]